ncbi:MAG: hypothetical protein OXE95_02855 [Chloroflexi bacterium]|nr:hypothetical protein [Chloroflexota bacterium]MCY4246502.1 hypothetical protein [Chloroflexota bacterium]
MDQNVQFIITVGTVIGVFLWLRHDINLLNAKIDKVADDLNVKIDKVADDSNARMDSLSARQDRMNESIGALRESLGWIRGRMGFTEPQPPNAD